MTKSVKEVMTPNIVTINPTDKAKNAAISMRDKDVSSLIVLDDYGQPVGIVTESDLVREVCTQDASSNDFIIDHIMSSPVATIDPNSSVETAANIMLENKVRHLVVKEENRIIGIITSGDFIKYLHSQVDWDEVSSKMLKILSGEN
jgi:signal-transduction protein with cAMP-binding, CBS, and nucleotidyltransferase domain